MKFPHCECVLVHFVSTMQFHLLAGFGENELGRNGLLTASELLDGVVTILLVVGKNAEYHLFVARHFANLAEIVWST